MFKTTVGQVTVLRGHPYDEAANTLVDERPPRISLGREGGNLYIFVETPRAEDRETVAKQLAEVVHRSYTSRRGSVTAALQQAVGEANRLLFLENRNSLPTERRTAGISCVVVRDDDLFIAQAGPAAAYVAHEGQVTRFPDASPWLDDIAPEEVDAASLGDRFDLGVALFHIQVSPGDAVLLVETAVARSMPLQTWASILSEGGAGGGQAVLDKLLDVAQGLDLTAMAVTIGDGSARPQADPNAPRTTVVATQISFIDRLLQWAGGLQLGDRLRGAARALSAALAGLWVALRTLLRRMMPGSMPAGEPARRSQARPAGRRAAALTTRASEPDRPSWRSQSRAESRTPVQRDLLRKVLIGAAIAIPIIAAVIVAVTLVQRGQTRQAEVDTLWQQAKSSWDQSNTVTDRTAQRTYLAAAQSGLDLLLKRQPKHKDALELQPKIMERLDEVNQVRRVAWVGELSSYPAGAELSRVVVEGNHVFVLDRSSDRVYHGQLDMTQQSLQPDSEAVVKKGDLVDGTLVNDLVDMVWMGKDQGNVRQRPALVVLESGGKLIEYDPTTGEKRALTRTAPDTQNYAELVGSHTGRLYVLDPKTNKVWRYDPTADGYSSTPYDWLQTSVDLVGVVDLLVGDGIYLLYADGRISRLVQGQPSDFSTADWDKPPSNAAAVSGYPPDETEWVYIADCGNSRIVQSANDGKFTRQFRLNDAQLKAKGDVLSKVTGLFVDESVKRAYFLSGNKLYVISLSE